MANIIEALQAPDHAVRELIKEYGATRQDLIGLGLSSYAASKWLKEVQPLPLAEDAAVQVPPLNIPGEVVALVPVNDLARRYLRHDVYIRDSGLKNQIRLCATHLGWSDEGSIKVVRPITARWRIGSHAAIPNTSVKNVQAIMSEPDVADQWPASATLVELGQPIVIDLPLGYAPNPTGGAPAIPGMRHHRLADLLPSSRKHTKLIDISTT